jgi:hypothetical protein
VTETGTLNIGTPSLPCPAGKGPTTAVLVVLTQRLLVGAYYDFCISIRMSSVVHPCTTYIRAARHATLRYGTIRGCVATIAILSVRVSASTVDRGHNRSYEQHGAKLY